MRRSGQPRRWPRQAPQPQAEPDPETAPGQVTPLAVDTFDGKVEPVDGTDERTHLAYELRLTNISSADLTLERVRVLDPSRQGRVVDVLSGDELAARIIVFGAPPDKRFGPGVSGFLFMDVTYPAGARLPERLEYRFEVSTSQPTGLAESLPGPVRRAWPSDEPARIGSPLSGKRWLTGEGCCDDDHLPPRGDLPHRRHLPRPRALRHRLGAGRQERQALQRAQRQALQLPDLRGEDPFGRRRSRGGNSRRPSRSRHRDSSRAAWPSTTSAATTW